VDLISLAVHKLPSVRGATRSRFAAIAPVSDPNTAIAEATLLWGRNSVVSPQDSLARTLQGTSVPASSAADASRVEVRLCRSASELAYHPAASAALDAFLARFGDSYVSSLRLGGEMQGVYTFFAQTRQEARQVEQAFGGALAVSGFSLGPELQRKASEVARSMG
jgi:hypothetical protein